MFCLENVLKCWVEGKLIKQSSAVALWKVFWSGAFLKAGGWEGKVEKLLGSFNSQDFPASSHPIPGIPILHFKYADIWVAIWRERLNLTWFQKKHGHLLWLKYLSHTKEVVCYSGKKQPLSFNLSSFILLFVFFFNRGFVWFFFFVNWQVITLNSYWWPFKSITFFPCWRDRSIGLFLSQRSIYFVKIPCGGWVTISCVMS